jgi:hypothetical protein
MNGGRCTAFAALARFSIADRPCHRDPRRG